MLHTELVSIELITRDSCVQPEFSRSVTMRNARPKTERVLAAIGVQDHTAQHARVRIEANERLPVEDEG